MFRFFRNQFSPEQTRQEDLSEFFNYAEIPNARHGFPNRPVAMAVDRALSLLAIAHEEGRVFIYGGDNAIWSTVLTSQSYCAISHMYFALGTGILIVRQVDHTLTRMSIKGDSLEVDAIEANPRLKKVACCAVYQRKDFTDARLLLGTASGNVFSLKFDNLEMTEFIVFSETVLPHLPSGNSSDGQSCVEHIAVNPRDPRKVLLVFNKQCIVLYDVNVHEVLKVHSPDGGVEVIEWASDGIHFMIGRADGALSRWHSTNGIVDDMNILFGPFPCQPIAQVFRASTTLGETTLFTGGMPRASYGDRYTVTVKRDEKLSVLDLASPIIDVALYPESNDNTKEDFHKMGYALILCEQEMICVDLADKMWRTVPIQSLQALHSSQVTASLHVTDVEEHVWKETEKAAAIQRKKLRFSDRNWPICAGNTEKQPSTVAVSGEETRQLFITGHANGTVRLWTAGEITMKPLVVIITAKEFSGYVEEPEISKNEDRANNRDSLCDSDTSSEGNPSAEWPPFVKIGEYDPCADDTRFAVQKIAYDRSSGLLAVGCRGGHTLVYKLEDVAKDIACGSPLIPHLVDESALPERMKRVLPVPKRTEAQSYYVGYMPFSNGEGSVWMQLKPAVTVTAVDLLGSRGLMAAGNEYGFAICDLRSKQVLTQVSLLSGQDLLEAGALDDALSRFKSMKKSIRKSFRRKKRDNRRSIHTSPSSMGVVEKPRIGTSASSNVVHPQNNLNNIDEDEDEYRPVERRIEARTERTPDEVVCPLWLIRVLKFAKTTCVSPTVMTDCLWIGSNGGRILCYAISDQRSDHPEEACRLIREIRLEHGAPIIFLDVLSSLTGHRLIVFTEEQIRAFSLPNLKATRYKYKLTAIEGEKVRKGALVRLKSRADPLIEEVFAAVMSNMGNVHLFSLVTPRKNMKAKALEPTDIRGMGSTVITPAGEVFYLLYGGSQYQRGLLAAHNSHFVSPFKGKHFPPPLPS